MGVDVAYWPIKIILMVLLTPSEFWAPEISLVYQYHQPIIIGDSCFSANELIVMKLREALCYGGISNLIFVVLGQVLHL